MDQIQDAAIGLVVALLTGALTQAAYRIGNYFKTKGLVRKYEQKKDSVNIAVGAVEQIAKNEGVDNKFDEAKDRAIHLLGENGIKISNDELNSMIEAAVKSMNEGFKKGVGEEVPYIEF